jgi:hypothetical protein
MLVLQYSVVFSRAAQRNTTDARLSSNLGESQLLKRAQEDTPSIRRYSSQEREETRQRSPARRTEKGTIWRRISNHTSPDPSPSISAYSIVQGRPERSQTVQSDIGLVLPGTGRSEVHPQGTAPTFPTWTILFVALGELSSAQVPRAVGRANERVSVLVPCCVVLSRLHQRERRPADPAVSDGGKEDGVGVAGFRP